MTARGAASQVVLVLLVVGAACVTVRTSYRQRAPLFYAGDSMWRLSYTAAFHARVSGAQLRAALPENTRYGHVLAHLVADSGLETVRHRMRDAAEKHDITAKAPKPGQYEFRAQFDIHLSLRGGLRPEQVESAPGVEDRARYLSNEKDIQVNHPAVAAALKPLVEGQATQEEVVERLFYHCLADIVPGGDDAPQDAAGALAKGVASPLGRARALVALCRARKFPARLVTGFQMTRSQVKLGNDVRPHTWVEVLVEDRWESYDPENGFSRAMPSYFVPVRRENPDIIRVFGASDLVARYSITPLPLPAGAIDPAHRQPLDILNLTHLPFSLHEPMEILLLLPLGALVTAVIRTIVGIRTFGTFTPTLLALAFVYCDWRTGLLVFFAVLLLGLTSRSLLDRLKLLLVPRLGIILTLVVLLMVFSVSMLNYFRWTPSAQTVLLPMVILTNLVERFYVTTEEDNLHFALQLLAATMAVAFVVYLLLRWKAVGEVLLVYPELHCFTVAGLILIGRYTGYRWTELARFHDLALPKE
ncbi:MAG: 7TM domain-containing protein [Thermoguttaceae bacterium]